MMFKQTHARRIWLQHRWQKVRDKNASRYIGLLFFSYSTIVIVQYMQFLYYSQRLAATKTDVTWLSMSHVVG